MKRTLSSIAAAALVLGTLAPAAFADTTTNNPYSDVSTSGNFAFAAQDILNLTQQGFVHGFSDGTYRPQDSVTRGQFLAYFMNAVKNVTNITPKAAAQYYADVPPGNWAFNYVGAAQAAQWINPYWIGVKVGYNFNENYHASYGDVASFFVAAMINAGKLTTAQMNGMSPLAYAKSIGLFSGIPSTENQIYVDRASAAVVLTNILSWLNGTLLPAGATVSVNAPSATLAPNSNENLSVAVKDAQGNAITLPSTATVTYSVDNKAGAIINGNELVVTTPGTYNVTATVDGVQSAPVAVQVFGQAVGYKVSAAAPSLLADGASTDTVTVTAVDASGNPVTNYSGVASVSDTQGLILDATTAKDQPADFAVTNGLNEITFKNGVATFAIGPTTNVNVSDTITVADTNTTTPLTSASLTVGTATSTVSKLALGVATGSPTAISANGQYSTQVNVSAENASGNTWNSEPGTYVTVSLTGPGSFVAGSSPVTSETVYVPSSGTLPITVYSLPGQAGNIVVSASSTSLTGASLTVPSYINTAAGSISVSSTQGTDSNGNGYTLYTVTLLDKNGHPITTSSANDAITVTDNSSNVGGAVTYGTVSNGVFTPFANGVYPGQNLVNGIANFAVETKTVGTAPATLTVNDTTNSFSATGTYSFVAGSANKLSVTPSTTPYIVKPGQTVTFSAQLQDANGNNVASAGQPVTFSFVQNDGLQFPTGQANYTVDTNSAGVASVSFTIPSGAAAGSLQLSATDTGLANQSANSTVVAVDSAINIQNYATQVAVSQAASPVSNVNLAVGDVLANQTAVNATAENAIGQAVGNDELAISSSNTAVVGVTNGDVTSVNGAYNVLQDLTLGKAGSATITVQDISNPDQPKASFTISVAPGNQAAPVFEYNGSIISSTNTVSVAAGTPVEIQVVNADTAGDPIPVTGDSAVTINLSNSFGGDFRMTPTGAPVSSVTLQPGQTTANVYFVSGSAVTLTTGTQTATGVPLAAPTGVTAAAGAAGDATVSWTPEAGAVSYNVLAIPAGGSVVVAAQNVTSTSAGLTGLKSGTSYTFEVQAVNGLGQVSVASAASNSVTIQ